MKPSPPPLLPKPRYSHREWLIKPHKQQPGQFTLTTETGTVICTLAFPNLADAGLINLIANAPEFQCLAEIYRDSLMAGKRENTLLFNMISAVLERSQ